MFFNFLESRFHFHNPFFNYVLFDYFDIECFILIDKILAEDENIVAEIEDVSMDSEKGFDCYITPIRLVLLKGWEIHDVYLPSILGFDYEQKRRLPWQVLVVGIAIVAFSLFFMNPFYNTAWNFMIRNTQDSIILSYVVPAIGVILIVLWLLLMKTVLLINQCNSAIEVSGSHKKLKSIIRESRQQLLKI